MTEELEHSELTLEVNSLRKEVVVLRESIDEFRDDLIHVLRKIADDNLLRFAAFGCRESFAASNYEETPEAVSPSPSDPHKKKCQANLF